MMRFEKLMIAFVDMMEADGYSVLMVQKPDVRTYIIKLSDDDVQGFDYVHGAVRFIEEYYPRIHAEHSTKEGGILEIIFKENVGKLQIEAIE